MSHTDRRTRLVASFSRHCPLSSLLRALFPLLLIMSASSCQRPSSWGLMLWDNDENRIPSGAVVPVYIRSNLNRVWVVGAPDGDARKGEKFEVPLWQLEQLPSRARALSRSREYGEWTRVHAETLLDGLPIREKPENGSDSVYRLRAKQIVKVLAETKGSVVSSGGKDLPGKWLRVMTDDGAIGYAFSYRLKLFEKEPFPEETAGEAQPLDTDLKRQFSRLTSRTWHPASWRTMLEESQIDLDAFTREDGLSFDEKANTLSWTSPQSRLVEEWGPVSSNGSGTWRFADGRVQIQVQSDSSIQLSWPELSPTPMVLVSLPLAAREIAAREKERRRLLLEALWRRGPVLQSPAGGTLAFSGANSFAWTGYDALVPEIIPAGLAGSGTAQIALFVDKALKAPVTGAIRFNFTVDAAAKKVYSVDFFYALEPDGVRFQYIPPSSVDGLVVRHRDSRSASFFFTRAKD